MKDLNDLTLREISEIVVKEQIRYELQIEPTGYGGSNITVTLEPWEPFDPKCPYGTPVVYVKDKQEDRQKEMRDIRKDVEGLWCDDITFCPITCEMLECPRNKKNIRDKTVPHSFSVDVPSDCPKSIPLK